MSLIGEKKTPLHVCSIESLRESLFLCGAYELQEGESLEDGGASRLGSLTVYDGGATLANFNEGNEEGAKQPSEIVEVGSCEINGGVLDCKVLGGDLVASALSTGCLRFYRINGFGDAGEDKRVTFEMRAEACIEEEGLFLSVDWECGPRALIAESSTTSKIVASTQQSSLLVFDVASLQSDSTPIVHIRDAHNLMGETVPAWITVFDPYDPMKILSGGDDCALKAWDLRSSCLIAKNTKSHDAGVTSLQYHPHREHIFASGSYDEHVRVWDDRVLKKPVTSLHVGGGVWRTKWFATPSSSSSSDFLALSCMQGGSCVAEHVAEDDETSSSLRKVLSYPEEASLSEKHLAYGIGALLDWGDAGRDYDCLMASCSFYENNVSLWAY
jgi:diphthamide biosynthesis protein 7